MSGFGSPAAALAASSAPSRAVTQETLDTRLVAQGKPTVGTSQHPPQATHALRLLLGSAF